MVSITRWLSCPDCHRGGGVIAFELEKKSITLQCGACGARDSIGFGFSRPVEFGLTEHLRDVYNELEDRWGPRRADREVYQQTE